MHKTTLLREIAQQHGTTPLNYLLSVMQDEAQPLEIRMTAAKVALPYCTPRLAAVHVIEDGGGSRSHEEWVRYLEDALLAARQTSWKRNDNQDDGRCRWCRPAGRA